MAKHPNAVMLSAWVDPALRERARLEAKASGVPFSTFIERAVQQAVSEASVKRRQIFAGGLSRYACDVCRGVPCVCKGEQQ